MGVTTKSINTGMTKNDMLARQEVEKNSYREGEAELAQEKRVVDEMVSEIQS